MYKNVSIVVRPLPDVQDERHRPGLDHRKRKLLGLVVLLVMSGHRRPVHVPPSLRLSDRRRSHHQQVLQVLSAGQLAPVLAPVRFGHGVPVLVLRCLVMMVVVRRRFDSRRRRHARHVILVAVVLGKVVGLVYL